MADQQEVKGRRRLRRTSPEGALEILCLLRNEHERGFFKKEIQEALKLTAHNVDMFMVWAESAGLVRKLLQHGWPRYQADLPAIEAYMLRFAAPRAA